jgi:hypothetical protein
VTFPLQLQKIEPQVRNKEEARSLAGGAFAGRAIPEASLVVWAAPAGGLWVHEESDDPFKSEVVRLEGAGTVSLPPRRERLFELLLPRSR